MGDQKRALLFAETQIRRRLWGLVAVLAATGVTISVVAFGFDTGPLHAARCLLGAREGWHVDYPQNATTPDDIREVIPPCVPVHVGYVNWNDVPEGELAIEVYGRDRFGHDDSLTLWVEGSAADATDPCRPLGPSEAPPEDCHGGPAT